MRCVPVLSKTDSSLKPVFSLVEPVLDLCCFVSLFLQAVLGNPRFPAAVLPSGTRRSAGLLAFFLQEISSRQPADHRRPRFPPFSHSIPGEGRH